MTTPRKGRSAQRAWAVQYRLGEDLEQPVLDFGRRWSLSDSEACRRLTALAVCGMDARYYPVVAELGQAMGGANGFLRACLHIQTVIQVAARIQCKLLADENQRARFIGAEVREFLKGKGVELKAKGPWAD